MLLIPKARVTRVYFEQRVRLEELYYRDGAERVIEDRLLHGVLDRGALINEGKVPQGWVADPKSIEFRRMEDNLTLTTRFIVTCNYHPVEDVQLFDSKEEIEALPSGTVFATPLIRSKFDHREMYVLVPESIYQTKRGMGIHEGRLRLVDKGKPTDFAITYASSTLKAMYVPDTPMSLDEIMSTEFDRESGVPVRIMLKKKHMDENKVSITMMEGVL